MYIQVYPLQIAQTMSLSDAYILVLDAPSEGKHIPVLIGEAEAQAIVMAIEQKRASRPLTHDLLNTIMDEYMLTLKKVTIDRFEEGIFHSTMYISDGFAEKHIDSRTSDAVVLAIMQRCDIYMNKKVLEETSMEPGALEGNLPHNKFASGNAAENIEDLERRLRQCEEDEDYEQAARLMDAIKKLKEK